jgi:hypothetical protein
MRAVPRVPRRSWLDRRVPRRSWLDRRVPRRSWLDRRVPRRSWLDHVLPSARLLESTDGPRAVPVAVGSFRPSRRVGHRSRDARASKRPADDTPAGWRRQVKVIRTSAWIPRTSACLSRDGCPLGERSSARHPSNRFNARETGPNTVSRVDLSAGRAIQRTRTVGEAPNAWIGGDSPARALECSLGGQPRGWIARPCAGRLAGRTTDGCVGPRALECSLGGQPRGWIGPRSSTPHC